MKLDVIRAKPVQVVDTVVVEDSEASSMDQWVTTKEAATIIGVSDGRVRQFVQENRLTPREKTDSDHYFRRSQVEALARKERKITGRPKGSKNSD